MPQRCTYFNKFLEVKDNTGHIVLQFHLISDTQTVQLQGEWWNVHGQGMRMVLDPTGDGAFIPLSKDSERYDGQLISPIFGYPSRDHWGEYASGKTVWWCLETQI